ncbi:MAG: alpha/beta hydrolase [Pseudomonadota bacterium]
MTELRAILDLLAYKPSWLPGFMRRHLLGVYRARGAHLDTVFWQLVNAQRADRIDQLVRNIAVPTLVVWGDHDQVIDPSCASEFSERIPASTLLLLERVGHIPMFEAPAATGAAHRKLLERAEEARRLPVIAATEPASQ